MAEYDDGAPPSGPLNRIQDDAVEEKIQDIAARLPKQNRFQERLEDPSRPSWDELARRKQEKLQRENYEEQLNYEYRMQLQKKKKKKDKKKDTRKAASASDSSSSDSDTEETDSESSESSESSSDDSPHRKKHRQT